MLQTYPWPGNVRELKNAVERAAILADTTIGPDLLPNPVSRTLGTKHAQGPVLHIRVGSTIEEVERTLILATLEDFRGDKKRAAAVLGISLKTLYTRLMAYRAAGHVASSDAASGDVPRSNHGEDGERFVESAEPDPPHRPAPTEPRSAKSRSDH